MLTRKHRTRMPFNAISGKLLLAAIGILLLSIAFHGCSQAKSYRQVQGTITTADGDPIPGAIIRLKTTHFYANSDESGHFIISIPVNASSGRLTAWAPGNFIAEPHSISADGEEVVFRLHPHTDTDNEDYQWQSSFSTGNPGKDKGCAFCHQTSGLEHEQSLPFDEWRLDAHGNSANNPRFLTMYLGSDLYGNQSPPTQMVSVKDYGTQPTKPDPSLPFFGPGYKLDFPDTAGNCATCHTPVAAINNPYSTDPTNLTGVETEGISCDFCHKIWDVRLDPLTGLPFPNAPGVLSYEFRRPPAGHQFFAGPFDDVAPGEDVYLELQSESQFCAPCHFGVFWDVVVYDSFGEWLRSPYSDPANGQTCQDCHMPRLGSTHFAHPEKGGEYRNPETIFSHRMPGAGDETLLKNSVSMSVTTQTTGQELLVRITLINDQAGHAVPTDSPLRHLILLVKAHDSSGKPLTMIDGPRLPAWTGVGDPDSGFYAGQAGMAFAKVLAEQWTNVQPTGAYWNPTYLVSDNRLFPFEERIMDFNFATHQNTPAEIHIRLLYRRAFIELANQKGWDVKDILMEEQILTLTP